MPQTSNERPSATSSNKPDQNFSSPLPKERSSTTRRVEGQDVSYQKVTTEGPPRRKNVGRASISKSSNTSAKSKSKSATKRHHQRASLRNKSPHKSSLLRPMVRKLKILGGTCVMLVFAWIARRCLLSALSYFLAGVFSHVIFSACLLKKTPAESNQHQKLSLLRLLNLKLVIRRVVGRANVGIGQEVTNRGGISGYSRRTPGPH
jgi:hypothetical protein